MAQTYTNWELIIVNDGSTDNTLDVLAEYSLKDSRIMVLNSEINQKIPASLNLGFSKATGELYTWTSDDNAFHRNALEIMAYTITRHPDIDLVYADYDIVDFSGTVLRHVNCEDPRILKFKNIIGACFLYKKSLTDKIGLYDTNFFLAEDYEYWIRAYLNGNLHHIPVCLYDYGWHEKSLTTTKKNEIREMAYKAKAKHESELLSKCVDLQEKDEFYWSMLSHFQSIEAYNNHYIWYCKKDMSFAWYELRKILSAIVDETLHRLTALIPRSIRKCLKIFGTVHDILLPK